MDLTMEENVRVIPAIRLLNKYIHKAKKVAIQSIDPIRDAEQRIQGFNVRVEGPPKHLSYFHRLIDEANLKIG